MPPPIPETVREQIFWSYANLARAHAALDAGALKYGRTHHIIRSRLYHGLLSGKLSMLSLFDDERLKMTLPQACCYCGQSDHMAVDHLIPKIRGGQDEADNLIWACRSCNSSKRDRDLLAWAAAKGFFPPLLLLRRYIKIVARYCEAHGQMEVALREIEGTDLPFDVRLLPLKFPPLAELKLWVYPENSSME